jgi:hypothetical protein
MFPGRPAAAVLTVLLLACGLVGCDRAAEPPAPDPGVRPAWQEVALPLPAGATGRVVTRDAARCADRWYVVGAVAGPGGDTAPAAWTSADARSWTAVAVRPKTYYGHRNVLYTAACRDGRLAAVGGKVGGAHGNPRVSSWRQLPDGSLDEVIAAFTLYGGPSAINVARLVAGPPGFLIVGNRVSGAAVWRSPDAAEFTILEGAPGLASDPGGETWAFDAVAGKAGWVLAGGLLRRGRFDRDPFAWTSPDGTAWTRDDAPSTKEYEELQRVAIDTDGTPVAVGLRGRAFGAWRREAAGWVAVARFGAPGDKGVPRVRGLAVTSAGLLAATNDGAAHALWLSVDGGRSWRTVSAPVAVPAGADSDVAVIPGGDLVVLLTDDARAGRVWLAPVPFGGG